jgi:hypothetical protein
MGAVYNDPQATAVAALASSSATVLGLGAMVAARAHASHQQQLLRSMSGATLNGGAEAGSGSASSADLHVAAGMNGGGAAGRRVASGVPLHSASFSVGPTTTAAKHSGGATATAAAAASSTARPALQHTASMSSAVAAANAVSAAAAPAAAAASTTAAPPSHEGASMGNSRAGSVSSTHELPTIEVALLDDGSAVAAPPAAPAAAVTAAAVPAAAAPYHGPATTAPLQARTVMAVTAGTTGRMVSVTAVAAVAGRTPPKAVAAQPASPGQLLAGAALQGGHYLSQPQRLSAASPTAAATAAAAASGSSRAAANPAGTPTGSLGHSAVTTPRAGTVAPGNYRSRSAQRPPSTGSSRTSAAATEGARPQASPTGSGVGSGASSPATPAGSPGTAAASASGNRSGSVPSRARATRREPNTMRGSAGYASVHATGGTPMGVTRAGALNGYAAPGVSGSPSSRPTSAANSPSDGAISGGGLPGIRHAALFRPPGPRLPITITGTGPAGVQHPAPSPPGMRSGSVPRAGTGLAGSSAGLGAQPGSARRMRHSVPEPHSLVDLVPSITGGGVGGVPIASPPPSRGSSYAAAGGADANASARARVRVHTRRPGGGVEDGGSVGAGNLTGRSTPRGAAGSSAGAGGGAGSSSRTAWAEVMAAPTVSGRLPMTGAASAVPTLDGQPRSFAPPPTVSVGEAASTPARQPQPPSGGPTPRQRSRLMFASGAASGRSGPETGTGPTLASPGFGLNAAATSGGGGGGTTAGARVMVGEPTPVAVAGSPVGGKASATQAAAPVVPVNIGVTAASAAAAARVAAVAAAAGAGAATQVRSLTDAATLHMI